MLTGFPAAYFAIKAFSESDTSEDVKKIDVPTLILHGDVDQIVPIGNAYRSAKLKSTPFTQCSAFDRNTFAQRKPRNRTAD